MSVLKDCGKTFLKCLAAGSGQMIGMAIGMAGAKMAGEVITQVVAKVKNREIATSKPYRRVTHREK